MIFPADGSTAFMTVARRRRSFSTWTAASAQPTVLRKARPTRALRCTCYHPLFLFNQFGDLERCALRPGNVHSADGWRKVLEPVVARYKERDLRRYFRGDAAFASPASISFWKTRASCNAIRLPKNQVLLESICHLLTRPVGRPPNHVRRHYAGFSYRAKSWDKARRVVARVEWHPSELFPRVGFIVTNLSRPAERVTLFYNQRGKAEQCIKEGKNAIKWTRLSCRRFRDNAVRLQLHALAYNLANFMRTLALPKEVEYWSLTTLREKLVKIGAKVVSHGRYVTFQLAEVAVPRELFRKILSLMMICDQDPPRRRAGEIDGEVKTTGGGVSEWRQIWQMAFHRGLISKIRPSDGCKGNTVPSTVVRGYDLRKPGGHLGNVGSRVLSLTIRQPFQPFEPG